MPRFLHTSFFSSAAIGSLWNNTYNHQRFQLAMMRFLAIFLPLLILLAVAAVTHFYTETKLLQVEQSTREANQVNRSQQGVIGEMRSVISDLTFLAKLNELWDILDNPHDERPRLMVAQEFLYFAEHKGIYDQIAILGVDGKELIRVNYGDGIPYIVEKHDLSGHGREAYFREAMKQNLGGIYMSSFVLDEDRRNSTARPHAVIRFATPLYDSHGEKKGLLFLNVRGEKLLWGFKKAASEIIDHAYLITNDGNTILTEDKPGLDNNIVHFDRAFFRDNTAEWMRILSTENGGFVTEKGLFTFATVYPLVSVLEFYSQTGASPISGVTESSGDTPHHFWKIVSRIPASDRIITYQQFLRNHLWLYLFVCSFFMLVSFFLAQISLRRDIAKAQADYERRLRDTLDGIQLAAVSLDARGRVIYCNDSLLRILGRAKDEVSGEDWFDVAIPSARRTELRADFDEVLSGSKALQTSEYEVVSPAGDVRTISWNNIISFCPNGKAITLTSIGHDITDQRLNEEQLHKLSRAVEQTQESIIITDAKGVMEYVNRGFTMITGYSAEEALGKKCNILRSGETSGEEYEKLWETIIHGQEWRGVFHNKRKNGELYWENTTISPIRNECGEITHYLAIKEDVTEHRRLREEVEQRNRELARAQSLAAMGQMASMVAHDLRNPLSSVKMTVQILKKKARMDPAQRSDELSDIALEQIQYMENILADLLLFSRPDALKPEWVQINRVLDNALVTTLKATKMRNARINTHYETALPTLHGDPTKLQQVFSNLIMNALQATDGTGVTPVIDIRVSLDLRTAVPSICVEISDNGAGITKEDAEKVFEPFFTTRAKGTGLGLSIVKRMLEQHKGGIQLLRRSEGGTVARVTLPIGPVLENMSMSEHAADIKAAV